MSPIKRADCLVVIVKRQRDWDAEKRREKGQLVEVEVVMRGW